MTTLISSSFYYGLLPITCTSYVWRVKVITLRYIIYERLYAFAYVKKVQWDDICLFKCTCVGSRLYLSKYVFWMHASAYYSPL